MEKRSCERIASGIEIKLDCYNKIHKGTLINMSEKGMFISTKEMYLPFEIELEINIPFKGKVLNVPAYFCRIVISSSFCTGIGVELRDPPREYLNLLDSLRPVYKS